METDEEEIEDLPIALPQQSSELVPSTSHHGITGNSDFLQVAERAIGNFGIMPVGNNASNNNSASSAVNTVGITGGDFRGSSLGPQDHRKELHLHQGNVTDLKGAHIGPKEIHHHHHYAAPQVEPTEPGGSQEQNASESEERVWIQLSNKIQIFNGNPIKKRAHVYRGEMRSEITGIQKLAVKLIEYEEQNLKEAKMLVKLALHHNVVDIVHSDVYSAGPMKFVYIAMELCHEQNLQELINESKANGISFDPVMMNSYAEQVVEGLKFIHEHGILHRDLKLDNLLLSVDKKFLKICDFGLSKELNRDHSVTHHSQIGTGTVGYMAPETLNDNLVSKMSDIFSLGIVIHGLWSYGLHPFGNDPDLWNFNIKHGADRDLRQILVPNKKDARDLLEKVLEFEPRQRPTAEEIQKHEYFRRKDVETAAVITDDAGTSSATEYVAHATRPKLPYQATDEDVIARGDNLSIKPKEKNRQSSAGFFPVPTPKLTVQTKPKKSADSPTTFQEMLQSLVSTQEANSTIIVFDRTSNHLQSYDPEKKRWKQIQAMNNDMVKYGFTTVVLLPHIYVMSHNKAVYRVDHTKLNSGSTAWERMADRSLGSISAAVLNGFIYASAWGEVEKYNSAVNEWVKVVSKQQLGSCLGSTLLSARGNLYCIGGNIRKPLRDVKKFNPTTSTWSNVRPMNQARCDAAAVEFDGKIYVMGGYDNKRQNSVEYYDIDLDSWTMVASMKVARGTLSACVVGERIYVVGGDESSPKTVEMFNPEKNKWKIVERMQGMDIADNASVAVSFNRQ